MTYHAAGSVENIGLSPYQVSGHPVMALIAQLNRFAGRTITLPLKCGTRRYLPYGALPITTELDDRGASTANIIMYDRLQCVTIGLGDPRKLNQVIEATTNPKPHVMANLSDYTTQIAQFADGLGLPAATVGITTRDPKMATKFPTMTVLLLGGLAVAAVVVSRRKR